MLWTEAVRAGAFFSGMIGDLIKIRPDQLPVRRQRRRRPPLWKRPWFRVVSLTLLGIVLVTTLSLRSYLAGFREKADEFDLSLLGKFEQSSILFDREGREIGRLANENRTVIQYSDMPQHLIDALVATEDSRFWEHKGVDYRGIVRAAKDSLFAGRAVSGASTITQQLARNTYGLMERTRERKLLEIHLAERIEKHFGKPEIIELYLNRIPFGKGFYGIEAAAQGYFSKSTKELTKSEAAALIGLIKSPRFYNPLNNPALATRERNETLDRMVIRKYLTREEANAMKAEPLVVKPSEAVRAAGYVQYEIEDEIEAILSGLGIDGVAGKGYRVYTTIDSEMQRAMEESLAKRLEAVEQREDYPKEREKQAEFTAKLEAHRKAGGLPQDAPRPGYLQGAAIALDNRSGAVLAMAGGRNFAQSQYNRVFLSKRPAATAFVPFVYTAAFEDRWFPGSRIIDQRMDNTRIMLGATTGTLGELGVETFNIQHDDTTSIRKAFIQGKNNCPARLGLEMGVEKVTALAKRAGFGDMPSDPAILLGRHEVSVRDMALAYTSFPNGGERPEGIHFVTRIERADGQPVWKRGGEAGMVRVTDPAAAWMTHSCLEESMVLDIGTASNARELGLRLMPVAGKTGTHINSTDLWFAGYSSEVTCAVWVGLDKREQVYPFAFSRHTALPVWVDVMNASVHGDREPVDFKEPGGLNLVELCELSGDVASDACLEMRPDPADPEREKLTKISYMEYIRAGTKIGNVCKLHTIGGEVASAALMAEPGVPVPPSGAAGINPELAAADAIPVRVTAATVLGKDPYASVIAGAAGKEKAEDEKEDGRKKGKGKDEKDGEGEKKPVRTAVTAAPAIPAAPVPVVTPGAGARPLLIQPGKADIE